VEEDFMRFGRAVTLAVLAVLAVAALARAASAQDIPEIPYQRFTLANGLTLVVHEDHKAPVVAVNVWYHVGSKNEKPGRTGFAHLFEHLMFNGSEHADTDWHQVVEPLGATDLNGTTNVDRTNYFQNVPVSALDTILWMESDRMGHLLGAVTQAKLDEQRGVVQNEKRQGENEPYGLVDEVLAPVIYPKNHPYSWTTIGSMEDLGAAKLDDVKEWFRTWYGAANAVVVVAGDVKADEVKKKVEHYFGDIPAGPPVAKLEHWVAKRTDETRQTLQDRVPQARLYFVWNTPAWGTPEDDQLDLVARILASGKTSRLYRRLVYDDRLATDVAANTGTAELGSTFYLQVSVRPGGDPAAVERAVKAELARFLQKGPTADELARAKTARLAAFTRGVERIGGFGGKSDVLAEHQVYGGSPDLYKVRLGRVKNAAGAEVWGTAKRWLSEGLHLLTVVPFPETSVAAKGADRTKRPAPGPMPDPKFPAFSRRKLSNGLQIIVAERHAVPVVEIALLVDAGYASDALVLRQAQDERLQAQDERSPGIAKLAGAMLDEGTRTRSALAISDELQRLGANLTTGNNVDVTQVSLSALRAKLDPSLALFADVVLNPSFPASDFERLKSLQLAAIDQESVQPFGMALRVMPKLIYGERHPYALPLTGSGTKATVAKLGRGDAVRWHATWFKPNNATIVVVGDTTAQEIVPKLEKLFAGWRAGEVPKKDLGAPVPQAQSRVYLLDRPGAVQSLILAGQVAPPRANPKEIEQTAMNTILGGQFVSRLNMNLREGKHWSYGSGSILFDARGPRPFIAYAPVQADKTVEAVKEVLAELRGIRGERPITADELGMAKNAMSLALPGEWETSAAVRKSIADLLRFGFDDRYYDTLVEKVAGLREKDLADAAGILDPSRLVWVVVGDRAKLEPALRTLNLGELRAIDADGNDLSKVAGR
jgi:zinc protease